MKRLNVKKNTEPQKAPKEYRGATILNTARQQLKEFIAFEVRNIYFLKYKEYPNFAKDEEYTLELSKPYIKVNVEVDATYLDVDDRIFEKWEVTEISVSLDGEIFLLGGEYSDEIDFDKLTLDEIAMIADYLEAKYDYMVAQSIKN